ncbi:MAG: group 1 truncated hemoglobin [Verrucomicrobiota bacterium]
MKNKINPDTSANINSPRLTRVVHAMTLLLLSAAFISSFGCGSAKQKTKNTDFFTSGSREADQRASQRMARDEQLAGSGEGAGEKNSKKAKSGDDKSAGGTNQAAQVEGKLALFDRLGGEEGIAKIVDDFLPRAMQDPRVNWQRKGVKRGGFSFQRGQSVSWSATPANIAQLKKHFVQFFALATGGPSHYEGKDVKSAHAAMHISNAEFEAAVGDLKASLDKLQIPNKEQKELLAVAESTRPQIVGER